MLLLYHISQSKKQKQKKWFYLNKLKYAEFCKQRLKNPARGVALNLILKAMSWAPETSILFFTSNNFTAIKNNENKQLQQYIAYIRTLHEISGLLHFNVQCMSLIGHFHVTSTKSGGGRTDELLSQLLCMQVTSCGRIVKHSFSHAINRMQHRSL